MAIIANEPLSCNYCQRLTEPRDTHIFETCEHIFHSACIDQERPICPICNPSCAICLEPTSQESKIQLACNHIFHTTCRDKWIETQVLQKSEVTCPGCRTPIDPETIIITSSKELVIQKIKEYYINVVGLEWSHQNPKVIGEHIKLVLSLICREESPEVFSDDLIHRTFLETCNHLKEALNAPMAINERAAPPFIFNTVMAAMFLLLSFLYALLPSRV